MYRNLEAEMARHGILKKDVAETLKVRHATVYDKMNGKSSFTLDEAFKIRNTYFPELAIEYLFEKYEETA
jgi:plasmid maintenance system antidote protein VapI